MRQNRRALKNGDHSLVLCSQHCENSRNPPTGLKKTNIEPLEKLQMKFIPYGATLLHNQISLKGWSILLFFRKKAKAICGIRELRTKDISKCKTKTVPLQCLQGLPWQAVCCWSCVSRKGPKGSALLHVSPPSTGPHCSPALSCSSSLMLSGFVGPLESEAIDPGKGNRNKQKFW